ncbi:hypothetical protein [Chryseobacterium lathyri]|jgi:hypothetical protein|uniref:Uncharacterized protein n=2 Tax=Chryseobacterium lathyri TaxID=395933 RepID=A0A511Y4Q7_9FLAO|nr:hypothetical protein [Chryseobacterium lathyri]GEN70170.1 hypothetical protein CLA01_02420 [Chryseobacterium lathyri]
MKKILNFLNPTKILSIFILFIISVVCIYQIDSYKYKQIRAGLIFLYFIPGLFIFIPVLIYNIKKSNKENNLKNKIILIILYFLYIFFMVLYAVICQWLGVENQMG